MPNDQPEPLAAVLAEMRADRCIPHHIDWADRIETAAERERNAHTNDIHDALYKATGIPGNAAALREALENAVRWLSGMLQFCDRRRTGEEIRVPAYSAFGTIDRLREALSAPARNCDRFATAVEAVAAFADHLRAWENAHGICSDYPDHPVKVPAGAFAWLYAAAEGGDHA